MNPGMTWISELHRLYWSMADLWEKDPEGLEATGAGFKSRCKPCGTGRENCRPAAGVCLPRGPSVEDPGDKSAPFMKI